MTLRGSVLSRSVVIYGLVTLRRTNRFGVMLLNILRDKTDACSRFVLIAEFNDLLTVKGLTNRLNSFLEAFVRKERHRLGSLGGRTRQRTSTHGDVRQELGLLIREALLLEELVVKRSLTSLLGLLTHSTSAKLGLTRRESVLLGLRTHTGEGLRRSRPHAVYALTEACHLARSACAHAILLLRQSCLLARLRRALPKSLLAQLGKILTQTGLLGVILLAETLHEAAHAGPHAIQALTQSLLGRRCAHALTIKLLAHSGLLLGGLRPLTE